MTLEVVSGHAFVTLLSPPVVGMRHFGVPPGGPFDRLSAALASQLVGGEANVYEVALAPASFRVLQTGTVAVFGAAVSATLGGAEFPLGTCIHVEPGETIEIGPAIKGARTYVASSPNVEPPGRRFPNELPPRDVIRAIPVEPEFATALDREWTVTAQLDRRGIRLSSGFPASRQHRTSEMTVPGAIQITPDGTAIILGPDGPTIGGYAVAGVVIDADLDLAGQLKPGDSLRFVQVSLQVVQRGTTGTRTDLRE